MLWFICQIYLDYNNYYYYYCYGLDFTPFYLLVGYKYGRKRSTSLLDLFDTWFSFTSHLKVYLDSTYMRNLLNFMFFEFPLLHVIWNVLFHTVNGMHQPLQHHQWYGFHRSIGPDFGSQTLALLLQISNYELI